MMGLLVVYTTQLYEDMKNVENMPPGVSLGKKWVPYLIFE